MIPKSCDACRISTGTSGEAIPSSYSGSVRLMTEFCSRYKASEVPDPYFGGAEGFETVLDLLEDACAGLLQHIRAERGV